MKTLKYDSNNSGGYWWLSDDDWKALEEAGWDVQWVKDRTDSIFRADEDGRWLGALATRASKSFATAREGIEEWERVTGQDAGALGCSCCGVPHNFKFGDEYISAEYPESVSLW